MVTSGHIRLSRLYYLLMPAIVCGLLLAGSGSAAASPTEPTTRSNAAPPPGLRLVASPFLVDVGEYVTLSLSAARWPGPATVTLTFLSPHHGFTGRMLWEPNCNCFRISVDLARRIHPLETARATAIVRYAGTTFTAATSFMVRGLARNGQGFAPGGTPHLTAWVSDPEPFQKEYEHFCGWVRTADGLGVPGYTVRFVVHYAEGTRQWVGGVTSSTGIVCSHRSIGQRRPRFRVLVDVYAGPMHYRTSFTPRP